MSVLFTDQPIAGIPVMVFFLRKGAQAATRRVYSAWAEIHIFVLCVVIVI